MLESTRRLQRAIASGFTRTCITCGAPEGQRITRKIGDLETWSLDTSLHFSDSATWRRPTRVTLHKNDKCGFCDHPFRGKEHPLSRENDRG